MGAVLPARTSICARRWLVLIGWGWLGLSAAFAATKDPALADRARDLRLQALAFEHGEGVSRDGEQAAKLYCEAAKYGDAEAQYNLGWMYANGRGVRRDDSLAAYFFELAAKQGHGHAQGMLRFVGDPVVKSPDCMADEDDAQDVMAAASPDQQKIFELVHKLAPQYGVVPRLALAVIRAESNFNTGAVSSKNAQGLMQLIPETSARFNVKKPFDPEQNIRGGLAYLRWLLAYFKGDVALVAAAYNAGEGAVNKYRGVPPYEETRGYVKRIIEIFKKNEHPFDPSIVDPSPELPRIRSVRSM